MKRYTIDWFKKNISPNEYQSHLEKQLAKYSFSNNPTTVFLDLSKEKKGFLSNVPFAAKDNLCVKNIETYAGSAVLRKYKPPFTATCIESLLNNGATLKMKTILDELGMGGTGLASSTRKLYSPYDKKRIVGGSSSGSTLAVAIGLVPFSLGTDTGDSIRKPAAFNGIIGFKPSWGIVSRWGVLPYAPSLDTVGIFSNTVKDTHDIFKIIKTSDDKDMSQLNTKGVKFPNKKVKIGIIKSLVDDIENKEMKEQIKNFVLDLTMDNTIDVKNVNFDQKLTSLIGPVYEVTSFTEALSSNYNLGGIHFGSQHTGENFGDKVKNNRNNGFGEIVKRRFALGAICLDQENQEKIYIKAKKVRTMIQDEYEKLFNEVDIIISPATTNIPPLVDSLSNTKIQKLTSKIDNFSSGSNLNGNPAITIPIGHVKEGNNSFPFSIELQSKHNTDEELLLFAKKIEEKVQFINSLHLKDSND